MRGQLGEVQGEEQGQNTVRSAQTDDQEAGIRQVREIGCIHQFGLS